MIVVKLFVENKLVAKAKNIKLDNYSTSIYRKFSFFGVQVKRSELNWECVGKLHVRVYIFSGRRKKSFYTYDFELFITNVDITNHNAWLFKGIVKADEESISSYEQGVVDVCNHWQNGKELRWNDLPKDVSITDYINACFIYSPTFETITEKNIIEIDFKYINTEFEFVCYFAEELIGKRGYMGRYLDTFDDRLLTLYRQKKESFNDKLVILKYNHVHTHERLRVVIETASKILKMYGFNIEIA